MAPNFVRKKLKNGITLLFEKRNLPIVSIGFAVRVGGINETPEEKGISHFIEHMVFKGTTNRTAEQIVGEIEKKGGILNAFTSELLTGFYCKIPNKNISFALDVLSDIIKNPLFDANELEKERKVIFEEIKMRKDNPQSYVFDRSHGILYAPPFGLDLAGRERNLLKINREKLLKRFKDAFCTENMILSVVGNTSLKRIEEFAEKTFTHSSKRIPCQKVIPKRGNVTEKRKGIGQANLIFAYPSPLASKKESYAAKVLLILMVGGMSSRLFKEIREKRNLAYSIAGHADMTNLFSNSKIYVGTSKENVSEVKKLILEEFRKVSTSVTEKELREVKEQFTGNWNISLEDSRDVMEGLMIWEAERGNAEEFYKFEKNIMGVKLDDVKKLARKVLREYSFFALVPE